MQSQKRTSCTRKRAKDACAPPEKGSSATAAAKDGWMGGPSSGDGSSLPVLELDRLYLELAFLMMFSWICDQSLSVLHLREGKYGEEEIKRTRKQFLIAGG